MRTVESPFISFLALVLLFSGGEFDAAFCQVLLPK
jgi:hypothetical protein